MSATAAKGESIAAAIAAMRANRPLRTEEICRDYLLTNPGCAEHLRLLGHALMKQGRYADAEEQIRFAMAIEPNSPLLAEDLGSIYALKGRHAEAVPWFEKAIRLEPGLPLAHKKLGQALAAIGQGEAADAAFRDYLERDKDKEAVANAAAMLREDRFDDAVAALKTALQQNPGNVDAMRYLAGAYFTRKVHLDDAEALLRQATRTAPDFTAAWLLLGPVLVERNKYLDAVEAFRAATRLAPGNAEAWMGLGNAHARASQVEEAAQAFARAVALDPDLPGSQMGYAHVLKTLGDQPGSIAAYREAIRVRPDFGEVYWSLANLKIFRFTDADIAAMEAQLAGGDLSASADIHFRFALGKAYEDLGDYDRAWHYYDTGNRRQRGEVKFDPAEFELRQTKIRSVLNREFLREREGHGDPAPDPIFIVGLPRSGSTLVEQILATHSKVEGTSELPILSRIVGSIGRYRPDNVAYPEALKELRSKDWRAYGQQFLEECRRHRYTDKPFFTDKLPNNFPHVGFIHLILPNAKIINARRHPLDSCLGAYKQLFGHGQHFTYDMFELSEYYKLYDAMMRHWHDVLPGKVLDVHYEETVTDLESQVRRILEHCGLEFEERCLRYHETERAVKTASSEQVRQPIYTSSLGKWRRYEAHLGAWLAEFEEIIADLPQAVRDAGLPGR
ncbi:MAG TPA: sulfotransferase [Woeseiaceae bacterium]|nr:sulfotransferase [Woeseiaceae bacterium]